jgi:hypothetical protein
MKTCSIPVEVSEEFCGSGPNGLVELHEAFLAESRTRDPV